MGQRTDSSQAAHRHISGLDGLRAIAIFFVLIAHNFEFYPVGNLGIVTGKLGTAGVHLFFAISGYLITTRFAAEVAAHRPACALKAFYLRRAFRILPPLVPYLLMLTAGVAMGSFVIRPTEILAAAFFASNYIGKTWYTGHFWSLSAEEHFYLFWAPMLVLLGFRKSQAAAIAIIVLTIITRPILLAHTTLGQPRLLEQTHVQLDFFLYASLFALWMRNSGFRAFVERWATHWAIACTTVLLGIAGAFSQRIDLRTVQAFCFGLLVLLLSANSKLWATRMLDNRLIAWVGKRSYGIYIWQQIIFFPVLTMSLTSLIVSLPLRTVAVFVVAGLSYRFLEEPLVRKAHVWSKSILAECTVLFVA